MKEVEKEEMGGEGLREVYIHIINLLLSLSPITPRVLSVRTRVQRGGESGKDRFLVAAIQPNRGCLHDCLTNQGAQ